MFNSLRLRILAAICVLPVISFLLLAGFLFFLQSSKEGKYRNLASFIIFGDYSHEPTKEDFENILFKNKPYDGLVGFVVFDNKKDIINSLNFHIFCEKEKDCLGLYIKSYVEATNNDINKKYGTKEIGDGIFKFYIYTYYSKDKENYVSTVVYKHIKLIIGEKPYTLILILSFISLIPIFFGTIFFGIFLTPKIMNPLRLLSKQISILSDYNFINGDASELQKGLPLKRKDEIGQLARVFSLMTEKLAINIRQLVETTANAERMQSDLNVARHIQLGSLRRNFSFPPKKKIELHADMIPARDVGGDLYDFFLIDEKHICIAIGDVVGKGVPAALTMTIAKKLIGSIVLQQSSQQSPSEIALHINEILSLDNPDFYYATLFFGILDVTTGELRYVNCGHSPQPLFTNGGNAPFFRKEVSGPPVGSGPGISYKEFAAVLPPGEAILLCTDGVTEAMNEEEQLFGDKRLLESFARMQYKPCKEVIDGILHEVKSHAGQEPQSDDITMLMIRRKDI